MLVRRSDYGFRFMNKQDFTVALKGVVPSLSSQISASDGCWTIRGIINIHRRIYPLTSDTKVLSKVFEIQVIPELMAFAKKHGYEVVLATKQNYYPDISFVGKDHKYALDIKTTYRIPSNRDFCSGFTLGSHGSYFVERNSKKNIQFPYNSYSGHFCLGIIYTRQVSTRVYDSSSYALDQLDTILPVVKEFDIFVSEKWQIASDRQGSGNTANIGSINKISDILSCDGMFARLGEVWFDDYWMNYGKIIISDKLNKIKKITNLRDFVAYRGGRYNAYQFKIQKRGV